MYTHVEILALGRVSDIDKTVKVLEGLAHKIDEVDAIEVGWNELPVDRAAHVAVISRFADRDAYEASLRHPEYAKTRQYLERVDAVTVHVAWPNERQ